MATVTDFLSSLGVNTHVDATSSPYGNLNLVIKDLAYLGVTQIRDHAWDTDLPAYSKLAAKGIKFDLIVDDSPTVAVKAMVPIKSSIQSFEGVNEVDITPITYPGVRGAVAAAVAEQKALYNAVKSNPLLSAIPVLNESIGASNNYSKFAATAAYSDVMNMHAYAAWGDAPRFAIPAIIKSESSKVKPGVVTETGYFTMLNNTIDPSGVTESVQARFTLDTLLDDFAAGVTKTYLYELLDEGADPNNTNAELHYGLFHADGTPKLAATAIHNLGAILSASSSGNNSTLTIKPTFSGLPSTGHSLQLTGNDGAAFLAVWDEPQVWNTAAQKELPVATNSVTVNLGKIVGSVQVFDPTIGTKPIATYANISKLVLGITDHPLLIEASGASTLSLNAATLAADAALAPAGSSIVAGADMPVMIGSKTGNTSFFVDTDGRGSTSRTIVNFHKGDTLTLWGYVDGVSSMAWKANQSANGYTGATLTAAFDGTANGPTASVTLAAFSMRSVHNKIDVTTGTADGTGYLRLTETA